MLNLIKHTYKLYVTALLFLLLVTYHHYERISLHYLPLNTVNNNTLPAYLQSRHFIPMILLSCQAKTLIYTDL